MLAALVALSALCAFASTADAAKLNVARRVEPTLDPYLKTELIKTPIAQLTADQSWLSSHANPIVVHDSDPTVSLNVTGWASKPTVAVYKNATGVNPYQPDQLAAAKDFLMSKNGAPVMVDGWRAVDIRSAAARKWWLYGSDGVASCTPNRDLRAVLDLYACGYKTIWLDNALTTPKQGFSPTPSIPEKSWAKGMLTLLKTLRAKKPAGTTFTINMHWTDTDYGYAAKPKLKASNPSIKAAKYANQVIIEGGAIDRGLHYALGANVPWSYRRLLNFVEAMHKQKVAVEWEKTDAPDLTSTKTPISGSPQLPVLASCQGTWAAGSAAWNAHVQSAAFNYASALLTFRKGDSVGDMCQYPGRGWRGYDANLGNPRGKRADKKGVISRKFSAGFIAVNTSDKTVTVRIPKAGVNLASTAWPVSNTKVRSVRLIARSAAVVKY